MAYIEFDNLKEKELDFCLNKEFLEANNSGAYSSSTISNCNTRKYHGVLVCRQAHIDDKSYVFLNSINETVVTSNNKHQLGVFQFDNVYHPEGYKYLNSFKQERGPEWLYESIEFKLKKQLILCRSEETVLIKYTNLGSKKINLRLDPFTSFRRFHDLRFQITIKDNYTLPFKNGIEIRLNKDLDKLILKTSKDSMFREDPIWFNDVEYIEERRRGYEFKEDQFRAGYFEIELSPNEEVVFSGGLNDNPDNLIQKFDSEWNAVDPVVDMLSSLKKSAGQFISKTNKGFEITAGFHWFGRWGRDSFIALPGLTLSTGKPEVCLNVLDTMLVDLKKGLLTNVGVGGQAKYNSADASLWVFWTIQKLKEHDSKIDVWTRYKSKLKSILENYRKGTMYNIHMQENGLLYGSQEDVALTWMDAVIDDVPVTPRDGNAVDLNALWYNAICFAVEQAKEAKEIEFVKEWEPIILKIKKSFNDLFWKEEKGYLADAVKNDTKDWSFRPNQVFAISLPYSLLSKKQSESVLLKVKERLLTNVGLRTLSSNDKKYQWNYIGNQKERDLMYHQGIVWPWILGHFVEANMKVFGEKSITFATEILLGFESRLLEHGLGSVSEIYDGNEPFEARGTIAQAWSVSELLRIKELIDKNKFS